MSINLSAITETPTIISSQLIQSLNTDQSQQATLEQQLATGDLVNQPSDNPSAASSLMQLNAGVARANQYSTNAADGLGWLSLANSTVNSVMSNLQTARQLVLSVSGSSLSGSQTAVSAVASQLQSIKDQIVALANTQYGGQALFSGTGNVTAAFQQDGKYIGGGNAPTRTVAPGVTVPVSVTGNVLFGPSTTDPNGLLTPGTGSLDAVIQDLKNGKLQQAQTTDLSNLDASIQNVSDAAASLGASYQRMQGFATQATNAQAALQSQISALDSVNVAQATTQLAQEQQTYQTGLWATAQIESHSLVQYL